MIPPGQKNWRPQEFQPICWDCFEAGGEYQHDWHGCPWHLIKKPNPQVTKSVASLSRMRREPRKIIPGEKPKVLKLILEDTIEFNSTQVTRKIHVLIDTGSEVNVLKKGLAPFESWTAMETPIVMTTASHSAIEGGDIEVHSTLKFQGVEIDTK